jgi:hypothetical protein
LIIYILSKNVDVVLIVYSKGKLMKVERRCEDDRNGHDGYRSNLQNSMRETIMGGWKNTVAYLGSFYL